MKTVLQTFSKHLNHLEKHEMNKNSYVVYAVLSLPSLLSFLPLSLSQLTPPSKKKKQLETTYCNLEELDNSSPEVVQLREERVARALWINDRLVALGDGEDEDDVEEDESDDDEDGEGEGESEVDSEEEELRRRFGRSQI